MKFIVLACFIAVAAAQQRYVWDYLKPAFNAAEVATILATRNDYPVLNGQFLPDDTNNFDCQSKHQPGFYADLRYGCQVFHRCDFNGNHTVYACVNTTVFNQITLTCDYWFNVDCTKNAAYEDFANSRLYQNEQPLFDTPPNDYVPAMIGAAQIIAAAPVAPAPKPVARPAPRRG